MSNGIGGNFQPAPTFDLQQLRDLQSGGTAYKTAEGSIHVLTKPKAGPPSNLPSLQGALPAGASVMKYGEFMRSLVATGASLAQKMNRDAASTRETLMTQWKDLKATASVGTPADSKGSSQMDAAAQAVLKQVKSLADSEQGLNFNRADS
jgi:hypothetical protein